MLEFVKKQIPVITDARKKDAPLRNKAGSSITYDSLWFQIEVFHHYPTSPHEIARIKFANESFSVYGVSENELSDGTPRWDMLNLGRWEEEILNWV